MEQSPRCSISQLRASLGAQTPSESFIILSAAAPSALINACPGVLASEAEAAFFKAALLIDGGGPGGTHSSRSKCLHSPFLSSALFTRPLGHSFLECVAASLAHTQSLHGLRIQQNRLKGAEIPKSHSQKLNPEVHRFGQVTSLTNAQPVR